MVVKKTSSAPNSPSPNPGAASPAAVDPLRGVQHCPIAKHKETEIEFGRLKSLVPTISKKQSVSKLDVILEAIRYIDQLQDKLFDQLSENGGQLTVCRGGPAAAAAAAAALFAGKENTAQSPQKRQRHRSQWMRDTFIYLWTPVILHPTLNLYPHHHNHNHHHHHHGLHQQDLDWAEELRRFGETSTKTQQPFLNNSFFKKLKRQN